MRIGFVCLALLLCLQAAVAAAEVGYPLTLEQRERLKRYIPRTFARLEARKPVNIVALGDSVTWMYTRDEENGNFLLSYLSIFGDQLSREFFYPGGIRVVNPQKGKPEKYKPHLGEEIWIENLAIPGRCALDSLQRITTDALLHQPDLMVIDFGINDSVRGYSLDSYRKSLKRCIDICKTNGTEVILLAPNLIQGSPGPINWGRTRPFATVARELAVEEGIMFIDLGKIVARSGGPVPFGGGSDPKLAFSMFSDRLSQIFDFDLRTGPPETLHPNEATHRLMGMGLFDEMFNGPPQSLFSLNGSARFETDEKVVIEISLRNQSGKPRKGFIGPMSMGDFIFPVEGPQSFELKPRENRQFVFEYARGVQDKETGDFFFSEVADPNIRVSFFVIDEEQSELIDLVTRLQPVSVVWSPLEFRNVSDKLNVEWQFVNGTGKLVRGTYKLGFGGAASKEVAFSLQPLAAADYSAAIPFRPPDDVIRMKQDLFVEVTVEGKSFRFLRELEATRDMVLGQKYRLSTFAEHTKAGASSKQNLAPGEKGITIRFEADPQAFFVIYDLHQLTILSDTAGSPLIADLSLDARPAGECGTLGFVDYLRVAAKAEDHSERVGKLALGIFGDGYDRKIDPAGVSTRFETRPEGTRRIEIRIPREYLYRHDWQLGNPNSILGVNVNISLAAIDPETGRVGLPFDQRYVITAPTRGNGATMYYRDARGFAVLRLTNQPVNTWSAHLY